MEIVDANIILRYILEDDDELANKAALILEKQSVHDKKIQNTQLKFLKTRARNDSFNTAEMLINSKHCQLVLHGNSGNPHVIGWNWPGLLF